MKSRRVLIAASVMICGALALAGCGRASEAAQPASPSAHRVSSRVPAPIDGAEAHRLVAAGAFLLDVRTPGEFSGGHAEGATNIPISDLQARLAEVPHDRVVVTYCASGARSRSAATLLRADNIDVRDLRTLSAWNAAE